MTCSIHRALREPCPTGCGFLKRDREIERLVAAGLCPYKGCIEPAIIGDMCVLHGGDNVPASSVHSAALHLPDGSQAVRRLRVTWRERSGAA